MIKYLTTEMLKSGMLNTYFIAYMICEATNKPNYLLKCKDSIIKLKLPYNDYKFHSKFK